MAAEGARGVGDVFRRRWWIETGTVKDYRALARFHYVAGDPATWAGVWRCVYADCRLPIGDLRLKEERPVRVVGVAVLSFPTISSRARRGVMPLPRARERYIEFLNRHVRTISRVIVHPQFRGVGIASALVARVCSECTTRYVEAFARMGEVHPLFERGGCGASGRDISFLIVSVVVMNANRMSEPQHRFLRLVRNGEQTLEALWNELQLNDKRFARWMRNRFFRRNLNAVLRGLAHQRFAVIEVAANMAAKLLEKGVNGQEMAVEVVAVCRTVIELAEAQRLARKKNRGKGKKVVSAEERDLCHPNAKAREKELARILGEGVSDGD